MKRMLFVALALVAYGGAFGAIRAVTPEPATEAWRRKWWVPRYEAQMNAVTNGGAKVVFVGDSITQFWETEGRDVLAKHFSEGDRKMLNLGICGDRTEHVLWRITEGGELDGYEAKFVSVMIGTNNTGNRKFEEEPPVDTVLGVRTIVQTILKKQTNAVIVLNAIFPRGTNATDACRMRNAVVNAEIRKFADGQRVFWCDLNDRFLDKDGNLPKELFPDYLHPSAKGYEIWYEELKPYLDYALSDRTGPAPKDRESKSFLLPPRVAGMTRIFPWRNGKGRCWWTERLLQKRNEISESKGEIDLVFFGDSITHNWENQGKASLAELRKTYGVLDIGYGGDQTQHLVWRGANGELDGYRAKCIMLMIGTNNGNKPEDVAAGIRRILDVIAEKQPQAKVLLLPIFPRGANAADKRRMNNEAVNALIKNYADGEKVIWVDFGEKFLDAQGDTKWCMPDRLHPNAAAYRDIWLPAVLPYFQKICGK